MIKKCFSLKEDLTIVASKIRTNSNQSLISPPPYFDENCDLADDKNTKITQNPSKTTNVRDIIRIRSNKTRNSLSQKKLKEVSKVTEKKEPRKTAIIIDSLEKCRSLFDKIIQKDKKYGHLLKQIKDVYEKELEKNSNENPEQINIKNKVKTIKKVEDCEKFKGLTKNTEKSKSQHFLISSNPIKFSIRNMQKKDSGITADTLYTSPNNTNIPELSLGSIKKSDFHDEFMSNYDNFSESWRKLINNVSPTRKNDS
ncbi:hypothetical protein SteCoe_22997 [Stentor coeruleus]|uniref:Uncharacterized protein n=1 Tax=Stentor coeruleus TaxID=5963 RepID=A0A1R2BKU5_9CILI|nr:hypothetical protein SteCoe_22997 [Stentor coeruleus]